MNLTKEDILFQNINVLFKELTSLRQASSTSTINLLLGLLITLCLINIALSMYAIFKVYKTEYNIVDFMHNYLKFHTQVISPRKSNSRVYELASCDDYEPDEIITSSKSNRNEISNGNEDEYAYDYEYFMNNQYKESELGVPRSMTRASAESTGISNYSKNNSVLKSKIDKRYEKKCTIKKDKSSDSISLKMKRSESWDAKNKVYTK